MNQKLSLKQIFSVFKREYTEWISNPRMLVCLVVLVMIREIVILPLKNYAFTLAQPINALEPVIGVVSSTQPPYLPVVCYPFYHGADVFLCFPDKWLESGRDIRRHDNFCI